MTMEYAWLLGVGLLMAIWQALWWIVGGYLLIGVALFLKWEKLDRQLYPHAKSHWFEFIVVAAVIAVVWPFAAFTRKYY